MIYRETDNFDIFMLIFFTLALFVSFAIMIVFFATEWQKNQIDAEQKIAAFFSVDKKDTSAALGLLKRNRDVRNNGYYQELAHNFKFICVATSSDFEDRKVRWKYFQACLVDKRDIFD